MKLKFKDNRFLVFEYYGSPCIFKQNIKYLINENF